MSEIKAKATEPELVENHCPDCAVEQALGEAIAIFNAEPGADMLQVANYIVTGGACAEHLDVDRVVDLAVGLLSQRLEADHDHGSGDSGPIDPALEADLNQLDVIATVAADAWLAGEEESPLGDFIKSYVETLSPTDLRLLAAFGLVGRVYDQTEPFS